MNIKLIFRDYDQRYDGHMNPIPSLGNVPIKETGTEYLVEVIEEGKVSTYIFESFLEMKFWAMTIPHFRVKKFFGLISITKRIIYERDW